MDNDDRYRDWLHVLEEDVIQGEYGYEPGEFAVFPEHWRQLYDEGLTPLDAWRRALNAFAAEREEAERAALLPGPGETR